MAKVRTTAKTRRQLTLYFNQEARKSAADQLKKASWLLAAGTGALGFAKGSAAYIAVLLIDYVVFETPCCRKAQGVSFSWDPNAPASTTRPMAVVAYLISASSTLSFTSR